MKRILTLTLIACIVFTTSVFAFESKTIYDPSNSCRLIDIQIIQEENPWLLWDVTFSKSEDGTVLTTDKDHPHLVGSTVIPNITFSGKSISFNGINLMNCNNVVLDASNELIITDESGKKARYLINITEENRGLPTVLINTDNVPIMTKLEYVDANISILGAGIYGCTDIYNQPAEIKLRGNTTLMYSKKPYRIKFNKKQNVLGMGSAKSWVLLAGYLDQSLIRNQTAFLFAQDLYAYTAQNSNYRNAVQLAGNEEKYQVFSPRMKMVEVYVNGEFKGLYDIGDHMQANELRINIDESGDEFAKDAYGEEYQVHPEGNVGYFIEFETGSRVIEEGSPDSLDWSEYSYITNVGAAPITPSNPNKFMQSYVGKDGTSVPNVSTLYFQFKLPEKPSNEQIVYITEYIQEFNDKLLSNDMNTKIAALEMIDVDSFIDWYIVNELFKNPDSQLQSSCYFYKDKDNVLYMAPIWDFDISAGGITASDMSNPTGWRTRNDEYCGWFRELFEIPSFKQSVINRWNEIHKSGIISNIFSNIEYFRNSASESAALNTQMWHEDVVATMNSSWMRGTEITSVADWDVQLDYLSSFLKNRIEWISTQQFETEDKFIPNTSWDSTKSIVLPEQNFLSTLSGTETFEINQHLPTEMMNLSFSAKIPAAFNFVFNMDISYVARNNNYTENVNISSTELLNKKNNLSYPSYSQTNMINAGTYTDMDLQLENLIKTKYANRNIIVTDILINNVTINYSRMALGTPITFSVNTAKMKDSDSDGVYDYYLPVEKTVLSGSVSILGKAEVGRKLIASTISVFPKNANYFCQWYRNDMPIPGANSLIYDVTEGDVGSNLSVKIIGTMLNTGTLVGKTMYVSSPETNSTAVNP